MLSMNESEVMFHHHKARAKSWAFDTASHDMRVAPVLPVTTPASYSSSAASSPSASSSSTPMFHCPEHECFRKFNRRYTLIEHMKTHTGEKPHVCPAPGCRKRFSTSGNLSRHKRLHGFIKPLECPVEGCQSTFPSNNKLEKHMKYHMGSPVHVCTIGTCGKTFSTMGNLNRHIKHQHQESESSSDGSSYRQHQFQSPTAADDFYSKQLRTKAESATSSTTATGFTSPMSMQRINPMNTSRPAERVWNSDSLLDSLATIFDDEAPQGSAAGVYVNASHPAHPDNAAYARQASLLDDMINFHVTNFQC